MCNSNEGIIPSIPSTLIPVWASCSIPGLANWRWAQAQVPRMYQPLWCNQITNDHSGLHRSMNLTSTNLVARRQIWTSTPQQQMVSNHVTPVLVLPLRQLNGKYHPIALKVAKNHVLPNVFGRYLQYICGMHVGYEHYTRHHIIISITLYYI